MCATFEGFLDHKFKKLACNGLLARAKKSIVEFK